MGDASSFLMVIFIFFVGTAGVLSLITVQHENAHLQIDKHHGVDSFVVYYPFFIGGYVQAENITLTHSEYISRRDYHLWNEIVGYNVAALCVSFVLCGLLISMAIMFKERIIIEMGG